MDASKYAWSCVLTQEYAHQVGSKEIKILHPIIYQSGLFKDSQIYWACLTKEAYAIYMSVKKLDYYLVDADIMLHSDHLLLKQFFAKNILNSKVNNWAIEISPFKIQFKYIKGIKNMLADTMSRLVDIDATNESSPEPYGFKFSYYLLDELPPIEVNAVFYNALPPVKSKTNPEGDTIILLDQNNPDHDVQRMVEGLDGGHYEILSELQALDDQCSRLITTIKQGKIEPNAPYVIKGDILKRRVEVAGKPYFAIVVPKIFVEPVLFQNHNLLGHNGFNHTYAAIHMLYYWKGMKASIVKYIRTCHKCQQRNQQVVKFNQSNFKVASFPMEFISMDLIGEFHSSSKSGHLYALSSAC